AFACCTLEDRSRRILRAHPRVQAKLRARMRELQHGCAYDLFGGLPCGVGEDVDALGVESHDGSCLPWSLPLPVGIGAALLTRKAQLRNVSRASRQGPGGPEGGQDGPMGGSTLIPAMGAAVLPEPAWGPRFGVEFSSRPRKREHGTCSTSGWTPRSDRTGVPGLHEEDMSK